MKQKKPSRSTGKAAAAGQPPASRQQNAPREADAAHQPPTPHAPHAPFTPHPRLFRWLLVITIVWLLALLTLFFVTVYPYRGQHPAPVAPTPTQPR
jgi:hypothetical protein